MIKLIRHSTFKTNRLWLSHRCITQSAQPNEKELLSSINAAIISQNKNEMEPTLEMIRDLDVSSVSPEMQDRIKTLLFFRYRLPNETLSINELQRDGCIDIGLAYTLNNLLIRSNDPKEKIRGLLRKNEWAMAVKDKETHLQTFNCLLNEHAANMQFTDFLDLTNNAAQIGAFDLFRKVWIHCREAMVKKDCKEALSNAEVRESFMQTNDLTTALDISEGLVQTKTLGPIESEVHSEPYCGYKIKAMQYKLEQVDSNDQEETDRFIGWYQNAVGSGDPFNEWFGREGVSKETRKTGSLFQISPFLESDNLANEYMTGPWRNDFICCCRYRRIEIVDAEKDVQSWKHQACFLTKESDTIFSGLLNQVHSVTQPPHDVESVKENVNALFQWEIEVEKND